VEISDFRIDLLTWLGLLKTASKKIAFPIQVRAVDVRLDNVTSVVNISTHAGRHRSADRVLFKYRTAVQSAN